MEDTIQLNRFIPKYFDEEIVSKAYSFSKLDSKEKTKETIFSLKQEIKKQYKEKSVALKQEIIIRISQIKEQHLKNIEDIEKTKDEALKHNVEPDKNSGKVALKEYSNIKKGIEIACKRSKIKENTAYLELLKEEKLKRVALHTEYVNLLYYINNKVSPLDRVRSKWFEDIAGFNLKATLTNKRTWIGLVPLLMLILIILAYFLGKLSTGYQGDLTDVINKGIFVSVVATGAVYIYSQGGFDMSLGNASLMCATIAALMYNATHNLFLSLMIAIVLGAVLGVINAILATMLNLPVMVMTLTMMNILAAIHEAILGENGGLISVDSGMINNAWIFAVFLIVFFILCWFIFNYTKVGRRNKFIGSNKIAAKFNGINLMKAGIISFAISGVGLGICGFLFACSKSGGKYGASTVLGQVGLDVVIAIVFGGMTTSGGPRSKVSCAIIGAFFAVFLDEFFAAISTPTFQVGNYCYMAKGIIFIIVSLANMWDTRGKMLASGGSIQ